MGYHQRKLASPVTIGFFLQSEIASSRFEDIVVRFWLIKARSGFIYGKIISKVTSLMELLLL
jgi:hypothetical protein